MYYPEIEVVTYSLGDNGLGWSKSKLFFRNYKVSALDLPMKTFGSKRKADDDTSAMMDNEYDDFTAGTILHLFSFKTPIFILYFL